MLIVPASPLPVTMVVPELNSKSGAPEMAEASVIVPVGAKAYTPGFSMASVNVMSPGLIQKCAESKLHVSFVVVPRKASTMSVCVQSVPTAAFTTTVPPALIFKRPSFMPGMDVNFEALSVVPFATVVSPAYVFAFISVSTVFAAESEMPPVPEITPANSMGCVTEESVNVPPNSIGPFHPGLPVQLLPFEQANDMAPSDLKLLLNCGLP